jgi:hypothetical protein
MKRHVMLLVLVASCAHKPEVTRPDPVICPSPKSYTSHCDALNEHIGNTLKEHSLQCLDIPGIIATGVYGPSKYPNENTLEAGFGGAVPTSVMGPPRPAGTISRSFSATKRYSAGANLDLHLFYPWLPNTNIKFSSDDEISVDVVLGDLKTVPIQNIKQAISGALDKTNPHRRSVEQMRDDLCKGDYVISTMALTAKPQITISSSNTNLAGGSLNSQQVAGFKYESSSSTTRKIALMAENEIVFAIQKRPSADMLGEVCNQRELSCVINIDWHGYTHVHSEAFRCDNMPPGAKVRATFDGYPIVTSKEDNKIFNGWITMSIGEPGKRCEGETLRDPLIFWRFWPSL